MMLSTNQFFDALDEAISDQFVEEVFRKVMLLDVEGDYFEVELDEKWVKIPTSAKLTVLTKVLVNDRTSDVVFGAYRVQLGIGNIAIRDKGMVEVQYCFATLYFSEQKDLTTHDFHRIRR